MDTKLFEIKKLRAFGDKIFIIQRFEENEIIYSYNEIIKSIEEFVEKLRELQVPKYLCIAVLVDEQTPATCVAILSILNHSCHFYSLNATNLDRALLDHLREIGVFYLITDKPRADLILITVFDVYDQKLYLSKLSVRVVSAGIPDDTCYIIATTGTTRKSKLVHVPYECILLNITSLSERFQISDLDVFYLCAPITFDPFVIELFSALYAGAKLIVTKAKLRLSPRKLLNVLWPDQAAGSPLGVTILQMTPSMFRCFGAKTIREKILNENSTLRVLLLGGEPFPKVEELKLWTTAGTFKNKLICNLYGITEISCWSTIHICTSLPDDATIVPIGEPIDNCTKLRIISNCGAELKGSCTGELLLGSSRRCYIPEIDGDKPNDKNEIFRATGDVVFRDINGAIFFMSRTNDIIKRLGETLSLVSVTDKVYNFMKGKYDVHCIWDTKNFKLICCIFTKEKLSNQFKNSLNADILTQLTPNEKPDIFAYIGQNPPINKHGKLDQKGLLKICRDQRNLGNDVLGIFMEFITRTLNVSLENKQNNNNCNYNNNYKKKGDDDDDDSGLNNHNQIKDLNMTFTEAGGTSFHAVSLSIEIGGLLVNNEDQHKFLVMMLKDDETIDDIIKFLSMVDTKPNGNMPESTVRSLATQNLPLQFKYNWSVDFGKCVDAAVASISERVVCVGSHSNLLQTVDVKSGTVLAKMNFAKPIISKVEFVREDLAVVGCYDGNLYAFEPLEGSVLWNINLGGEIKAKPLVCNYDRVVVCTYSKDYNAYCISLKTHKPLWRFKFGAKSIHASPIHMDHQHVLICTLDGTYVAVHVLKGTIKWRRKIRCPIFSTPAVLPEQRDFVFADVAGYVYLCSTADGKVVNVYKASGSIHSGIIVKPGLPGKAVLFFGCHDAHLYCLKYSEDSDDPSRIIDLLWTTELNSEISATPAFCEHACRPYIIACTNKGSLMLINLKNGMICAQRDMAGEIFSSPCVIKDSRVCFGCRDNSLYCLSVVDNDEIEIENKSQG